VNQQRVGGAALEALEPRKLLSISQDEQGWTNFVRDKDARTIYVSSSAGSDRNSGLTSNKPVQTLARARSLLRDGAGDWMLLKAGDVWYEPLHDWKKSGKSEDEPLLISSYGRGERPVIESGNQDGFSSNGTPIRHVAVVGILFHAQDRDPDSPSFVSPAGNAYGLRTQASVSDLLVENCVFDSYVYGICITGMNGLDTRIGIRRNLILDSYATGGNKSMGLYVSKSSSVLIEGNVFDHNGWSESPLVNAPANVQSHNIYLAENNADVYVRGNIIANASSHGLQIRGGGTVQGNLFINNPIGMLFGNGRDALAGGVSGDVSGNVFLGTGTINGSKRGWALEIGNIKPAGQTFVANNIFAQSQIASSSPAILLSSGDGVKDNAAETVGINDLTLEGNIIYRWNAGMQINGDLVPGAVGPAALNGLLVRNNDFQRLYSNRIITQGQEYDAAYERFQGNRYFNPGDNRQWFRKANQTVAWDQWYAKVDKTSARVKVKYNDPERRVESYNAMLGGKPSVGAFLTQARLMARRIWDPRYAATSVVEYVRTGFKVKKIPPTVTATNLSSKNQQPTRSAIFFIFDKDVSPSLDAADLKITDLNTNKRVPSSSMKVTYDATTHTATWTFPGLSNKMLNAGEYQVELSGHGVFDVKKTWLDGNYDGLGGDGFFKRIKIKPTA
jgi:hypothetical protein